MIRKRRDFIIVCISLLLKGCFGERFACGTVSIYPAEASGEELLIIGGKDAAAGMFPWVGYLAEYKPTNIRCSLSLISPKLVITAGHCVYRMCWKTAIVVFGLIDIADLKPKNIFQVHRIYYPKIFKKIDDTVAVNDVAMIELARRVNIKEFEGSVNTICLPHPSLPLKGELFLAGWGVTKLHTFKVAEKLQYMVGSVLKDSECLEGPSKFCTVGRKFNQTPYRGDSGGPAVKLYKGRYYLYGVLSGGDSKFAFYTIIPKFLDWIKYRLKRDTLSPNCTERKVFIHVPTPQDTQTSNVSEIET